MGDEITLTEDEYKLLLDLFFNDYYHLNGASKPVFDTLEGLGLACVYEEDFLRTTSKGSMYIIEHWKNKEPRR